MAIEKPIDAALSTEVRSPYTRPCLLCHASDHTVMECATSLTSDEKRRKLQARMRCFHCAKRNHVANTGSQRTFVRQDVARALNCPVQGVELLTQFTFGKTHRPVTLTCNRVSVTLGSQHSTNETSIDALEVPEISAVTRPPVDGAIIPMMTHHGLVPADAVSEAKAFREDEVSILIGSDFYWDVVTGHIT
ncbi:hypothetical protein HPB49_026490 [Dermacentor silvarum]|nr:hypothetical protein HPB49_026490 [Dermacentor silvarum]